MFRCREGASSRPSPELEARAARGSHSVALGRPPWLPAPGRGQLPPEQETGRPGRRTGARRARASGASDPPRPHCGQTRGRARRTRALRLGGWGRQRSPPPLAPSGCTPTGPTLRPARARRTIAPGRPDRRRCAGERGGSRAAGPGTVRGHVEDNLVPETYTLKASVAVRENSPESR